MSARFVYDHAPLGAVIQFSDHTVEPPVRFKRKHMAWKDHNDRGRLICKSPSRDLSGYQTAPAITLHMATTERAISPFSSFSGPLDFAIASLPPPGTVRVLQDWAGKSELLHLASDRAAAERWLADNCCSNTRLEAVAASEIPAA